MPKSKPEGCLFVVSAPSGSGKSTLCTMMLQKFGHLKYSVSYTTRKPRENEIDGRDYHFVSMNDFQNMIRNEDFLEWEEVHGNYYGTSKSAIEKALENGEDIFLDIDPKGAMQLQSKIDRAVFIFITAPSFEALRQRLIKRGTDTLENIEIRMKNAEKEIEYFKNYDYLIINDESENAFMDMQAVYRAEKLKTKRIKGKLVL